MAFLRVQIGEMFLNKFLQASFLVAVAMDYLGKTLQSTINTARKYLFVSKNSIFRKQIVNLNLNLQNHDFSVKNQIIQVNLELKNS